MTDQILSWIVTAIGISGFFLAGRKVWWCWYLNVACQVLWAMYAYFSNTPAFYVASAFYFVVFSMNAIKWTKEHLKSKGEAKLNLYRTKAVPVDARRFDGGVKSADDIIQWLADHNFESWWKEPAASYMNGDGRYIQEMPETIRILDREGVLDLCPGEYVVLGSSDRIYIFQSDAFESAYERVA
jgi:hypothetical protein